MSGHYMDRDGNLVHTRSGDIIKIWKEVNPFTGEGEHVTPRRRAASVQKEEEKKDSKREALLDGLKSLEIDLSMLICFFEDKEVTEKTIRTLYKNLKTLISNIEVVVVWVEEFEKEFNKIKE